jgi:hypothetical protein
MLLVLPTAVSEERDRLKAREVRQKLYLTILFLFAM